MAVKAQVQHCPCEAQHDHSHNCCACAAAMYVLVGGPHSNVPQLMMYGGSLWLGSWQSTPCRMTLCKSEQYQQQVLAPTLTLLDHHRLRCGLVTHQLPCSFNASLDCLLWAVAALPHIQLVGHMQQEAAAPVQQCPAVALLRLDRFGHQVSSSFSAMRSNLVHPYGVRGGQAPFLHIV
jgi:hypothetical protein